MSASLLDTEGETLSQHQQDLSSGKQVQLNTEKLLPGKYILKTQITSTSGELCSENTQSVELIAGPFLKKITP